MLIAWPVVVPVWQRLVCWRSVWPSAAVAVPDPPARLRSGCAVAGVSSWESAPPGVVSVWWLSAAEDPSEVRFGEALWWSLVEAVGAPFRVVGLGPGSAG